jgi:hypothetical protein
MSAEVGLAVLGCAIISFALSAFQSRNSAGGGSDSPVHLFIIRAMRESGHRLFARIPGLINDTRCGALPLYTHWLLSFLPPSGLRYAERYLNPAINALHVLVVGVALTLTLSAGSMVASTLAALVVLFTLTPQLFHVLSARNFGFSARGIGLLLLTLFFFAAYAVETDPRSIPAWAGLIAASWLIWGFSTFGAQALCLLSITMMATGHWGAPIGAVLGLVTFIAAHPRYSLAYLEYTARFIVAYRTELAPIYILSRRPSIWRDLVADIWIRLRRDLTSGLRYAYENSVMIAVVLTPVTLIAAIVAITGWNALVDPLVSYAGSVALAGVIAAFATSFRPTRFLGEPERYLEAVAPWGAIAGGVAILGWVGLPGLGAVVALFSVLVAGQMVGVRMLAGRMGGSRHDLAEVVRAIDRRFGREARVCCNNEQITKLLMRNDWRFSCFLVVGQSYCGLTPTEAFSVFPYLTSRSCEHIAARNRINALLLDRTLYEDVFAQRPADLESVVTGFEDANFRLLFLTWRDEPIPVDLVAAD